jgi:anti-sigma factor ChrR (cupin superfamily)
MKRLMIALALTGTGALGYAAGAATANQDVSILNPAAIRLLVPKDIKWRPAAGLSGTETATLVGDPSKPGFYVIMNRFQPGSFSRPHYHADDRYIVVLKGTWWAGTGARWNPAGGTVPVEAGSFAVHSGKQVHYDGARAGGDEAVVMIFGQGPATRHDCEGSTAETGAGPCADARKAVGL